MFRHSFVCPCTRTVYLTYTVFNEMHGISDLNNTYKFHDIPRIFTENRALEGWHTDKQSDRQNECINTFQLHWKVIKSPINQNKYVKIRFKNFPPIKRSCIGKLLWEPVLEVRIGRIYQAQVWPGPYVCNLGQTRSKEKSFTSSPARPGLKEKLNFRSKPSSARKKNWIFGPSPARP